MASASSSGNAMSRQPDVKTKPIPAVEPVSSDLPFVRPNPLLYPPSNRKPTPPSFAGLPFVPASQAAADDRAALAAPTRGDTVPVSTDGPFAVAVPVFCIRALQQHLVVIAKLSCDWVDGAPATVREEAEPLNGDAFEGDEPDAPIVLAGDFAPVKEACDLVVYAESLDDATRPMALHVRGRGGSLERRVKTPRELGPISPYDAGRVALLGTYDVAWFEQRWPHYAADLDVRYFQSAPGPQRLASARGDESFRIDGVAGDTPRVGGQLPGLRPVAIVRFVNGERRLLDLRLDTISFFTADRRADLVWRAALEVSDDDAPEIESVFVTTAGVDEVLAEEEIERRALAARIAREGGEDEEPEALADEPTSVEDEAPAAASEEVELPDAANDEVALEAIPAKSPQEIATMMREAGADEEDIAEMLAALTPAPDAPDLPPAPATDVRAEVIRRLEANESLEGLELFSADLSDLDFSGRDFSGFDLTGTSFARANLSEATLDEAELSGAILESANLTGASAKAATMIAADLTGACLEAADLESADLSEAVLDGAKLDDCNLAELRLYDARAERASFKRAVLRGARAEGARANEADFTEALLDGSVWERASLEGAKLERASLVDVSLMRARCSRASFLRADLTDGRLGRADFKNAFFMRANLFEANLDRADMSYADLRGSSLHGASTVGTNLQGANLDGAITSYSRVGGRLP